MLIIPSYANNAKIWEEDNMDTVLIFPTCCHAHITLPCNVLRDEISRNIQWCHTFWRHVIWKIATWTIWWNKPIFVTALLTAQQEFKDIQELIRKWEKIFEVPAHIGFSVDCFIFEQEGRLDKCLQKSPEVNTTLNTATKKRGWPILPTMLILPSFTLKS